MSKRKKHSLPFDSRGGTIAVPRRMLNSAAYRSLSVYSKVLMIMLQEQWRPDRPVDYGIREAMEKVPCSKHSAMAAFQQLTERGFISMVEESMFNSRTKSRTRSWKLTWMPFNYMPPSQDWENWSEQKEAVEETARPVKFANQPV